MRTFVTAAVLTLANMAASAAHDAIVMLHFSDYHSHAVPFVTESASDQGGIARAVGYLEREKKRGALVFSGGDMMNKGAPSWSDKYGCAEWPWLNGIVDAMALGNHDVDYGLGAFARCQAAVTYPILSGNVDGLEGWRIFEKNGRRIGVFAVAGPDLPRLMTASGLKFSDPVAAARRAVEELRAEKVDAVVLIGHQQTEDDYALAKAVPGIDVIFGTHAHLARDLTKIPGTETWFISGGQYVEFISRVELTFGRSGLSVSGKLVPVDRTMPESEAVARRVAKMQQELESDPEFRTMFQPIGRLDRKLTMAGVADLSLRVMKQAASAEVALTTVSSIRGPLEAGPLTLEALTAAVPYENEVVVCTMNGEDVLRLLTAARGREGDSRAYVSAPEKLDPVAVYRVATTDYLARGYADSFRCEVEKTGIMVQKAMAAELARK